MSSRLSDNDRTLLSAFMDGELHGEELRQAERLAGSSEEARTYLGHLRSLRGFSTQAFPAVSIGAAAGATGKLTGSAITAAAKKSALVKGFSFGGWGATGLVAAASVAAGVTFALNEPPTADRMVRPAHASPVAAVARPAAAVALDTSDLLVPPMSASDMVHFAVDGTIPIDATRKQYLTLASHGRDSVVVELHDKPPTALSVNLDDMQGGDWQELDSVRRAIRTMLLQYKGKGIAVSCDIPSLRLKTLEHLQRIRPKLPVRLWEEIETVKRQVTAAYSASDWTAHTAEWSKGVPYVVLSLDSFGQHRTFERIRIPDPMSAMEGSFNVMIVSGAALGELQAMTPPEPPTPPTFQVAEGFTFRQEENRPQKTIRTFNPTGELPTPRERQIQVDDGEGMQMIHEGAYTSHGSAEGLMIHGNGKQLTITLDGDTLIRNIESTLRMVDSTLLRINGEIPRLIEERRNQTKRRLERSREELRRDQLRLKQSIKDLDGNQMLMEDADGNRMSIDGNQIQMKQSVKIGKQKVQVEDAEENDRQQESGNSIQVEVGHEP